MLLLKQQCYMCLVACSASTSLICRQLDSNQCLLCFQEYIREIGACLIQLEQTQDKGAQAVMEKLTVEASRLLGSVKLLNLDVHNAMLDGKLDPSLANTHRLGTVFYSNLTVLTQIQPSVQEKQNNVPGARTCIACICNFRVLSA